MRVRVLQQRLFERIVSQGVNINQGNVSNRSIYRLEIKFIDI